MATGRNAQIDRVLAILNDLFRYGDCDVYQLAKQHQASEKTIRRDLDVLALHFPIEAETGEKGLKRWRIRPGDQREKLASLLDAGHYLALRVAMGTAGSSALGNQALLDLSDRIDEALGPKMRGSLDAIEKAFYWHDRQAFRSAPPDVLSSLVRTITDRQICLVTYAAAGGPAKKYKILPLKLFVHEGAVFLFALAIRHQQVIQLNLHRLRGLKLLDAHAAPPKDFDAEKRLRAAFKLYGEGRQVQHVLRFDAGVAGLIRERQWHPDQKIKDLPDGSVELSFPSPEGSYEVESWVASWRTAVEVVKPVSLRRRLGALGRWLDRQYRPGRS